MELCIRLELLSEGKLRLDALTTHNAIPPISVPLPFREEEIAAISHALDVNARICRRISTTQADYLWDLGALSEKPQPEQTIRLVKPNGTTSRQARKL